MNREAMLATLPNAEQCMEILHLSLERGDMQGVEAALRVLVVVDPRLAADAYDTMRLGLKLRGAL